MPQAGSRRGGRNLAEAVGWCLQGEESHVPPLVLRIYRGSQRLMRNVCRCPAQSPSCEPPCHALYENSVFTDAHFIRGLRPQGALALRTTFNLKYNYV